MYVASWIALAVAIGSLAYGLSQPQLTFIYVSIGASVVAMLLLLAGVLRKKPVEPATAGAPYGPSPEEAAAAEPTEAVATRPVARAPEAPPPRKPAEKARKEEEAASAAETAQEEERAAAATATKTTTRKSAAKTTAGKSTTGKTTARKTAARTTSQVVAIPERGTYHLSACRFVKGRRDTEKLAKTTAKRRGYSACGVCKPDAA